MKNKGEKELNNLLKKINNKELNKEEFIGVLATLIFEKSIFNKNKDLYIFLNKTLNVQYLDYIIASRTLLFARISREVYEASEEKFCMMKRNMELLNSNNKEVKIKKKKSKNANEKLAIWMEGV